MDFKEKLLEHIREVTKDPNADFWTLKFDPERDIKLLENEKNKKTSSFRFSC